jgi:hypothetical protein
MQKKTKMNKQRLMMLRRLSEVRDRIIIKQRHPQLIVEFRMK